MRYAFAKLALVTTVLTVFAADASAQGRGRRWGGNFWNNVASWYLPNPNTGWYAPGSYSNWNYPVQYGDSWYGRGGYRSYYTPSYSYYTPSYSYYTPSYSYYTTPSTSVVPSNPIITTSFYEPSDSRKSLLTVTVPTPDAEVWLNGTLMSSQGMERNYSSPPLEAGLNYTYTVKAQWMIDGKPIEQIRDVTVRAGQRSTVDFRQPSGHPAPLPVPNNVK